MPAQTGRPRRRIPKRNLRPPLIHAHESGFVQKIETITSRGMGDLTGFVTSAVYRRTSTPQSRFGAPPSISSQLPVPKFLCPRFLLVFLCQNCDLFPIFLHLPIGRSCSELVHSARCRIGHAVGLP